MARATNIEFASANPGNADANASEPNDAFGSVGFDFGGDIGGSIGGDDFDPSIHVGRDKRNANGSYTRKRGRKSGGYSATRSESKKNSHSVNAIESALVGIHAMVAAFTKTPEMVLESDESKPLAIAVADVAKHYDIPGVDAVVVAWVGLIMVAGKVYVPRYLLVKHRLDQEAKQNRRPATPTLAVNNDAPATSDPAPEYRPFFDILDPPSF